MVPFSTAERKVLGVAAPSQQQTPLNWVYLPPPNPYNLQAHLTGFVNQIYVQATSPGQVQAAICQVTETLIRRRAGSCQALIDRRLVEFDLGLRVIIGALRVIDRVLRESLE